MIRSFCLMVLLLVAGGWTQQSCDFPVSHTETVEDAIPVTSFSTGGNDRPRASWCIAHCAERVSIIGTMRFKPASANSTMYKVKKIRNVDGSRQRIINGVLENPDDPFDFCIDKQVKQVITNVFYQYNDTASVTKQIALQLNRPGWAFLAYVIGPPPAIQETGGEHIDANFCDVEMYKFLPNGSPFIMQIMGGLIDG